MSRYFYGMLLASIIFGSCYGTYYVEHYQNVPFYEEETYRYETFYNKEVDFFKNTDGYSIRLEGSACIKQISRTHHHETLERSVELPLKACVPFLIAQAIKKEKGNCTPQQSVISETKNFFDETSSSQLILNSDCLCYKEHKSSRRLKGHETTIQRTFASFEACSRFFQPDEFSLLQVIAEGIMKKYIPEKELREPQNTRKPMSLHRAQELR